MEAKKRNLAAALAFIATLTLTLTLYVLDSHIIWDIKNLSGGILRGAPNSFEAPWDKKPAPGAVRPDLSSCREGYGREGLVVNCCPPEAVSSVPFVDFEFPDPSSPVRIRRPVHHLDAEYIAKYNKALSIMKSLPYSDPRSFKRQEHFHCLYCTGAYRAMNSGSPIDIHNSWLFLPWHRMFLFFHERILGSLIGDDSFALPFWAWDVPEGMTIPEMFTNISTFFDPEREASLLPSSIVELNFFWNQHKEGPEEQIEVNMAFMYNQVVSGAKKTELFMGCAYKAGEGRTCHAPGTLELAPHDTVHEWIGNSRNPGREDMGSFYSAARDPIFYPHHSNVDRLWEIWRELNEYKLDISDPDWLDSYIFFYDWDLKLVKTRFRDVLHMSKLGYAYEEVGKPWLNARPKPSISPTLARLVLKSRANRTQSRILSRDSCVPSTDSIASCGRTLDKSITINVPRPKTNRTKEEKEEEEEVIVVYGIRISEDAFTRFDVYVNLVDETSASPRFREFAGTFAHVPKGVKSFNSRKHDESTSQTRNLKLGISELLQDLESDLDKTIWVTLVPKSRSCVNVTIDGVRIDYVK